MKRIIFVKREGQKSLKDVNTELRTMYMEETYPEQRSFINADPPFHVSPVKEEWPMLIHKPFFYKHGNKLLAKDVKVQSVSLLIILLLCPKVIYLCFPSLTSDRHGI